MLTKLKYVGVRKEDLIEIYVLYIRSIAEYCSVAFHSSLTVEQSNQIERIQKTCLKVILDEMYIDYASALEMSGLDTLYDRRVKLFPLNSNVGSCNVRNSETYSVKFASTSTYRDSTIPF